MDTPEGVLIGVGSDHTDRRRERTDVAASKTQCQKVLCPEVWRLADVEAHWDALVLRAWTTDTGKRRRCQEGSVGSLLPVPELLAEIERAGFPIARQLIFGGTLPTLHGFILASTSKWTYTMLEGLRELSAASDLLDAAIADHLSMHRTDLRCLDFLSRAGLVPAGRLGEAVGLTSGALTIAVDRLERAGYVQRQADPGDRRRVLVGLAPGADQVVALFADLRSPTLHRLRGYSDAELQLLSAFLQDTSGILSDQATSILRRSVQSKVT